MHIRIALFALYLVLGTGAVRAAVGDPPEPAAKAAVQTAGAADTKAESDVVCAKERPLGTRIARTVCRSRAEKEASAEAARRMINSPVANTSRGD